MYIMKIVLQYYVEKIKDVECEEESKDVSHSRCFSHSTNTRYIVKMAYFDL